MGLLNPKKLKYLHDILDRQGVKIKNRKMRIEEDDVKNHRQRLSPDNANANLQWRVPYKIIAFIANRILEFEDDPNIAEKYELIPWTIFKDILFDVYNHRIQYAPELNGAANTSYCSLSEHLLIFFVDKYSAHKRDKAEKAIVDLLINLRYYYDIWQRA